MVSRKPVCTAERNLSRAPDESLAATSRAAQVAFHVVDWLIALKCNA
jgi:hypothetical protein